MYWVCSYSKPWLPKSSTIGGKVKKENCAFLTRMSHQGKRARQGQVELGSELFRAAPPHVMKMRLVRKMGTRPVLQLDRFREPRGRHCCRVTHQSQKHFMEFAVKCCEMTGLGMAATMPGQRYPRTV